MQTLPLGEAPTTAQKYNYDLTGRVINSRQTVGTNSYTMSYTYNAGGTLTSETYPSGGVVNFGYDGAARLASVTSGSQTYANQFTYGDQGMLASMSLGNGTVETYAYNARQQLKTLSLKKGTDTLQSYEYRYGLVDTAGNVDETKNNGQVGRIEGFIGGVKQWQQRFSYDTVGRLTQASEYRGDNNQRSYLINYAYDLFGNRYQHAASNPASTNPLPYVAVEDGQISKLTNRFTSGVAYDDAGNVETDQKFRGKQYQYDANNRQRWSANMDGSGAVTAVYDGTEQRVAIKVNGVIDNVMVYDAMNKLMAEYSTSAGAGAGGVQYVFADRQGSTRVVTEDDGDVISRQDYQPFGEELGAVGMRLSDSDYGTASSARQKYAGMEKDEASGMSHTLWRKYDSKSGRWTSPDPYGGSMTVADPQSFNRYTYVNNDPVNLTDPTGLINSMSIFPHWVNSEGWLRVGRDDMQWQCRMLCSGNGQGQGKQGKKPKPKQDKKHSNVYKEVAAIKKKAQPLAPGEKRVPTEIKYLEGELNTYNGEAVVAPDGNVVVGSDSPPEQQRRWGEARINGVVVLDQKGNIMGPETGIEVMEFFPNPPKNFGASKPVYSPPNADGIKWDTVGVLYPTEAEKNAGFKDSRSFTLLQRINVGLNMTASGGHAPRMVGDHTLTITNRTNISSTPVEIRRAYPK
ncbi:MAG TPA: RHS repeat-associated core domain-containing protein [Pyrinomonadaceae bacterium]|nr:RHS repeat-associated core domain-containing protein [Pyrinomonadaceae bacterium]